MRFTYKAALLAAAACIASPALAQDDELVITATRLPNAAERLPADVTVIDVGAAQSRGVSSVAGALTEAPGMHIVQGGGFGAQASIFSGGANSNHTLVLFDGIRLNDPSSPNSAFDVGQDTLGGLTRIEIVQGPMSAVYGSDAIGGVVNLLPRHGREGSLNAQLDVSGGTFNTLTSIAAVDGTLGRLRYAVTAEAFVTDGYDIVPERMITHTGDDDGAETTTLTGVFDFAVSDALSLDLLVRQRESRNDFDALLYTMAFEEYRADDADLEMAQNDLFVGRVGATWRLNDTLSVRATTGELRYEREERDGGATTARFDGERRFSDVTLDWRAGSVGVFSNVAGAAGVDTESEEIDIATLFTAIRADQDRTGGFVTVQGDVNALTLTAAVRADDFEGFGTQMTWRAGGSYVIADSVRIYANAGTSYRAPTLNERFDPFYGNPALEAEEAFGWEAGGEMWFAAFGRERGVELGALYRRTDVDNLVSYASTPPYAFVNINEAELESIEARIALRPLTWLTAEYAYVHTLAENGVTGAPLARRPEDSWTATLRGEHGPFMGQIVWRHIGEQLDRLYGDDSIFIAAGHLPAYDLLGASLSWDVANGAQVYVAGRNLTDETYESPGSFAGAPRSIMFGVRLNAGAN